MARLGDVCDILNGFAFKSEQYIDDGIRIIRIANVQKGYIEDSTPVFYPIDNKDAKKYSLEEGDMLMSLTGNVGRVAKLSKEFLPAALNQRVACLRIKDGVALDKAFLFNLLNSDYFEQQCIAASKGVAQKNMSTEWLKEYEIPMFSLKQQKVIAYALDKVTELITLRKEQLAKLEQLVKSRFIELFGDPETNPKGLEKVLLSDIAEYFNGLTYSPDNVTNDGTIVLRSSNIQNSQLDFADTVRVNSSIKDKLIVKDNDILMCSRNGSARLVGKVALIKNLSEPMTFGAFMMIIRSRYYPYLMTYFQMDAFRRQISTGATTTINQITGNMLNKISLPLPKMADIIEFAAFVEQTDKSKLAIQQSLDKLELLKKSLMQEYFG